MRIAICLLYSDITVESVTRTFCRELRAVAGTTFGVKYAVGAKKNTAVDGLVGIGLSTLTVDSVTSQGAVFYPIDLLAFTVSYGLVVEFGNAQVGLFSGFDFLSYKDQTKYTWIYRNKPWLSFGVGFSLFSFNVKSP